MHMWHTHLIHTLLIHTRHTLRVRTHTNHIDGVRMSSCTIAVDIGGSALLVKSMTARPMVKALRYGGNQVGKTYWK